MNLGILHFTGRAYANVNPAREILATAKTLYGSNYNSTTGEIDFRLASPNATDVTLCIFDEPMGKEPIETIDMKKTSNKGVWTASYKKDAESLREKPIYYGYRVFGPNWQKADNFVPGEHPGAGFEKIYDIEKGFRFNPNKLSVDPYSFEWSHNPEIAEDEKIFYGDKENYLRDSALEAPKSVFKICEDMLIPKVKTKRSLSNEKYIAEVHMKDLTWLNSDLKSKKGTYAAASEYAKKLKDMGVTMVEFLPLNEFNTVSEPGSSLKNHWGYMSLSFFALSTRYAGKAGQGELLNEFREMIKAFHENDIKVCMDVVYNHDGEAIKQDGLYYSLTGIGDEVYHKTTKDGKYRDNTGCGNDFNLTTPQGQALAADAVAFYAKQGVDAFRFDLAAAFMDTSKGKGEINYKSSAQNFANNLPVMLEKRGVKVDFPEENGDGINLIAEPWNAVYRDGNTQYQATKFSKKWAEWSDTSREMLKKDSYQPYWLPQKDLRELFEGLPNAYKNSWPVNYAFAHDGQNTFDANTVYNLPWSDDKIQVPREDREGNIKKQMSLLLLSRGTPMIQLGDLIGHTKKMDHNSYNQDNEINYLDFTKAMDEQCRPVDTEEGRIYSFIKGMADFRAKHPILSDRKPFDGVEYFEKNGENAPNTSEYWEDKHNRFFGMSLTDKKSGERIYVASSKQDVNEDTRIFDKEVNKPFEIALPKNKEGKKWYMVCDSGDKHAKVQVDGATKATKTKIMGPSSVAVFIEK